MADKAMDGAGMLAVREGLGTVSICGCGVVSLNLGAFSLRMEPRAFAQLEEMVREATEELYARSIVQEKMRLGVSAMTH